MDVGRDEAASQAGGKAGAHRSEIRRQDIEIHEAFLGRRIAQSGAVGQHGQHASAPLMAGAGGIGQRRHLRRHGAGDFLRDQGAQSVTVMCHFGPSDR